MFLTIKYYLPVKFTVLAQKKRKKMATCLLNLLPSSWISYLVSGSFEQAVSATLSASDRIHKAALESVCDHAELLVMLESAGMVLVQALKELKR
jgi:hypothetical protein